MTRALTISLVALLGAALVAATLAWQRRPGDEPQLDRQWTAQVRVIAGDGVSGWIDGPADRARFSDPFGVAVAKDGTIFVAEGGDSDRIRAILPNGRVTTFAGAGPGFVDGPREVARFSTPSAIALGPGGVLYVADTGNNAIRRIAPDGAVTTFAGDGVAGHRDGAARAGALQRSGRRSPSMRPGASSSPTPTTIASAPSRPTASFRRLPAPG